MKQPTIIGWLFCFYRLHALMPDLCLFQTIPLKIHFHHPIHHTNRLTPLLDKDRKPVIKSNKE